jgi:hypothetical protein
MRLLLLSMGAGVLACGHLAAQTPPPPKATANGAAVPQIPFGQTYRDFQFPLYQNGQLSYTLSAASATGTTVNRAATTDLKIDIYTNGKVTTTITSPKADLYAAERIMRTKNTVDINRADLEATAKSCDFDVINRKYLLRENVRVVLKHFDVGGAPKTPAATGAAPASTSPVSAAPVPPAPADDNALPSDTHLPRNNDSLLDMPGSYANTNSAPIAPAAP